MVSQTTCVKSSVLKHFDSFTTLATFRSAIAACNILRAIKGADAHAARVAWFWLKETSARKHDAVAFLSAPLVFAYPHDDLLKHLEVRTEFGEIMICS
jgi:hypothetical protein